MLFRSDVTHGKPDPEPYLKGAKRLGFAAKECLVVEDAPAGIESAYESGMKVVGITSTYDADRLAKATAIVRKLTAIEVSSNGTGVLAVKVR